MKTYNIYFKDGDKIQFENFFAFYITKEGINSEIISRLTTEEDWIDLQAECMKVIEQSQEKRNDL